MEILEEIHDFKDNVQKGKCIQPIIIVMYCSTGGEEERDW